MLFLLLIEKMCLLVCAWVDTNKSRIWTVVREHSRWWLNVQATPWKQCKVPDRVLQWCSETVCFNYGNPFELQKLTVTQAFDENVFHNLAQLDGTLTVANLCQWSLDSLQNPQLMQRFSWIILFYQAIWKVSSPVYLRLECDWARNLWQSCLSVFIYQQRYLPWNKIESTPTFRNHWPSCSLSLICTNNRTQCFDETVFWSKIFWSICCWDVPAYSRNVWWIRTDRYYLW